MQPIPRYVLREISPAQQQSLLGKTQSVELSTITAIARGLAAGDLGTGDEGHPAHRILPASTMRG